MGNDGGGMEDAPKQEGGARKDWRQIAKETTQTPKITKGMGPRHYRDYKNVVKSKTTFNSRHVTKCRCYRVPGAQRTVLKSIIKYPHPAGARLASRLRRPPYLFPT